MVSIVQLLLSAFRKQCQQKKPPHPKRDEGASILFRVFLSRAASPEIIIHWDERQVIAGVGFGIIRNDVVKIGWHIFLKDIMDYAAIRRES